MTDEPKGQQPQLQEEQQQEQQQEEARNNEDTVSSTEVPIELQLEEVDMDDEMMDPLEWTVRKVVPIPKAYFWETGNHDLPASTKLWHRTVGTMSRLVKFMDSVGKPVAEAVGVGSSRFDYVTSTMTEEQMEEAKRTAEERKAQSMNGLSTRNIETNDDDDDEGTRNGSEDQQDV